MNHWADYVIFVVFLAASIGIGLYHAFTGGKQRTNEEFIMANRKLKVLPTAVSLIVSYMSALSIIGGPSEIYSYGTMAWLGYCVAATCGTIIVSLIVIPWLYPLKLTSVYYYFYRRYGTPGVQIYISLLGITNAILYTGTAILAPAIAMETSTGVPTNVSIPIIAIVCTIYTALGGMRAVIWTDVFQSLVMFGGMVAILIKAFYEVGGITESFKYVAEEHRNHINLSPDPTIRHTIWTFIFGLGLGNTAFMGFQQSSVQRFSAVATLKESKGIPWIWWLGTCLMMSIANLGGVAMFAYYASEQCDPILSNNAKNSNELFPLFVTYLFKGYPGFTGLFIATLYSATLSTVSSTLSGAAANAWDDILRPMYPNIPEHRAAQISKLLVMVFGCISIGLAFVIGNVPGPILQITISLMSAMQGPMLGLFLLAGLRCLRWTNWQGVLIGGVMGLIMNMWLVLGGMFSSRQLHAPLPPLSVAGCPDLMNITSVSSNDTFSQVIEGVILSNNTQLTGLERFYSLSYCWYTLFGCVNVMIFGMLASLILRLFLPRIIYTSVLEADIEHLFIPLEKIFRISRDPETTSSKKEEITDQTETKITSI